MMDNAEHAAYRRAIEYMQADIWYYRQKIMTDIYQKQKQLYAYFFKSQNTSPENSLHVDHKMIQFLLYLS